MHISTDRPPNYDAIAEKVDLSGKEIFCYGDTIYNPGEFSLTEPLIEHEKVHSVQQGDNPDGWWDRYLTDKQFRFLQELEAHRKEYHVARKLVKNREFHKRYLEEIVRRLSGPLYGNVVSRKEARKLIRRKR